MRWSARRLRGVDEQGAHCHHVPRLGQKLHGGGRRCFVVDVRLLQQTPPMATGQDAQRTVLGIAIIQMQTQRNHRLQYRAWRHNVDDTSLRRPWAISRSLPPFGHGYVLVLMPRHTPVGARRLVEEKGTNWLGRASQYPTRHIHQWRVPAGLPGQGVVDQQIATARRIGCGEGPQSVHPIRRHDALEDRKPIGRQIIHNECECIGDGAEVNQPRTLRVASRGESVDSCGAIEQTTQAWLEPPPSQQALTIATAIRQPMGASSPRPTPPSLKAPLMACLAPDDYYYEGERMVFTEHFHLRRGWCCRAGCRHCPWQNSRPDGGGSIDPSEAGDLAAIAAKVPVTVTGR